MCAAVQECLECARTRCVTRTNDWPLVYPADCCREVKFPLLPVEVFAFLISHRTLELGYFILASLSYLFERLLTSDYCINKVALVVLTTYTLKAMVAQMPTAKLTAFLNEVP